MTAQPPYVPGSDEAEIARLDTEAGMAAPATSVLLREAGIAGRVGGDRGSVRGAAGG